jgi:hypothetical protein
MARLTKADAARQRGIARSPLEKLAHTPHVNHAPQTA